MGAQNRRRDAPREGKQRLGRREREHIQQKCINMARKSQPKEVVKLKGFLKNADLKIYIHRRRRSLHFYWCLRALIHDHTVCAVL